MSTRQNCSTSKGSLTSGTLDKHQARTSNGEITINTTIAFRQKRNDEIRRFLGFRRISGAVAGSSAIGALSGSESFYSFQINVSRRFGAAGRFRPKSYDRSSSRYPVFNRGIVKQLLECFEIVCHLEFLFRRGDWKQPEDMNMTAVEVADLKLWTKWVRR
jgi:hypothetical protein